MTHGSERESGPRRRPRGRLLWLPLLLGLGSCASFLGAEGTRSGDCWDDIDNDGDGLLDCADPSCSERRACRWQFDDDVVEERSCMEDFDGDGVPDVFPRIGPVSSGEYDGCEVYFGEVQLAFVPPPICEDRLQVVVETRGWTSGGTIQVFDTSAEPEWLVETFEAMQHDSEPNEWWDRLFLEAEIASDEDPRVAPTVSHVSCPALDEGRVAIAVRVFSFDDPDRVTDCIVVVGPEVDGEALAELDGTLSQCDWLTDWPGI